MPDSVRKAMSWSVDCAAPVTADPGMTSTIEAGETFLRPCR